MGSLLMPSLSPTMVETTFLQLILSLLSHSSKSLLKDQTFHLIPHVLLLLLLANEITKKPSAPNAAAMIAYITEAVTRQGREFDPVCAAATDAYFDAYIQDKSEASANEAAAVAYLDTLEKSPNFDVNSACGKAAAAYIAEF